MDSALVVFVAVYVGMVLGRVPGLAVDRAGIALAGGIAVVALGGIDLESAWHCVDVGTICLLFGLMLVSAQFRHSGFYDAVTHRLAARPSSPERLLLELVLTSGTLSAVLTNDVVCLAVAPVLVDVCRRRTLDPVPFLLGLAAASNAGSAGTILGNPQNLLIGEALDVSFARYLYWGLPPALASLGFTWWILQRAYRGRFERSSTALPVAPTPFDRGATRKGIAVLAIFVAMLLACPLERGTQALLAGLLVLVSRQRATRSLLDAVDWPLLVLFVGLFVVNGAVLREGHPERWLAALAGSGLDVRDPGTLFGVTAVGSNLVSNVPLVMLLLPAAEHERAAPILALASTLAGNLLLIGSIANLIVVEQARRLGVEPVAGSWSSAHWRTGLPITLGTLAIAAAWLAVA